MDPLEAGEPVEPEEFDSKSATGPVEQANAPYTPQSTWTDSLWGLGRALMSVLDFGAEPEAPGTPSSDGQQSKASASEPTLKINQRRGSAASSFSTTRSASALGFAGRGGDSASWADSAEGPAPGASHPTLSQPTLLTASDYDLYLDYAAESESSIEESERVLSPALLQVLHSGVPTRFKLLPQWRLLYSTARDGCSIGTLYARCRGHEGATLLVVRDTAGAVFGAFATEPWAPHLGHYGSGESFLWRLARPTDAGFVPQDEAPGKGASDRSKRGAAARRYPQVVRFAPTGENQHYMVSETGFLAAGCSDGRFGLAIDADLLNGSSAPTATYGNDCLASDAEYTCASVELWGVDRPSSDRL